MKIEKQKLGNILLFQKKTRRRASEGKTNNNFKFFTSSPIQSKTVSEYDFDGEYLIFGTGGIASIHYQNGKFSASADCLVASTNELIIQKYVYYYLKYNINLIERTFQGSGLKHTSKDRLSQIEIVYPLDKDEQRKLVFIFDKVENMNRIRIEVNENPLRIITSSFFEMFGNPFNETKGFKRVKLSEICEINPKKNEVSSLSKDTRVSFIEMASVSEKGEIKKQVEKSLSEVSKAFTYFRDGDVLFAKITPCMENGKGAIANGLINKIGFGSTEFHVLRANKLVLSEWLFTLTKLSIFREYCKRNMTGTAGQKRVPRQFLENIEIYLPPISLQDKFLKIYLKIKDLEKLQKKSTQEIKIIYDNLMEASIKNLIF